MDVLFDGRGALQTSFELIDIPPQNTPARIAFATLGQLRQRTGASGVFIHGEAAREQDAVVLFGRLLLERPGILAFVPSQVRRAIGRPADFGGRRKLARERAEVAVGLLASGIFEGSKEGGCVGAMGKGSPGPGPRR